MACNHEYPDLCEKLGRHITGRLLEHWSNRRDYRKLWCNKAGVDLTEMEELFPPIGHISRPIDMTCINRGEKLRTVKCKPCQGTKEVDIHRCNIYGECALRTGVYSNGMTGTPVQSCFKCVDQTKYSIDEHMTHTQKFYENVRSSQSWFNRDDVKKWFQTMFYAQSERVRELDRPRYKIKRGIVICGGGWKFFPSLYVTVRVLRKVGCNLPIQIWCLNRGEYDIRMEWALSEYDVEWVIAEEFYQMKGIVRRTFGGWEMKPFAALHSPFAQVISLDADCYPVYNPEIFMEHPEFQAVGASFWPDQVRLTDDQWERFGLRPHDEQAWESGQFIIDKNKHYAPLVLTNWLNDHSDYVYKHIYGDKDTFHLAWRKTGYQTCIPTRKPGWDQVAFVQKDFDGNPLFIHRTRDKFRWPKDFRMDNLQISRSYRTQQYHQENKFIDSLPHEQDCHDYLKESMEMVTHKWGDYEHSLNLKK